MRAVSDSFLNALRGSHGSRSRATVCTEWQEGVSPTGTEIPLLDGDIRFDASADIRASLDMRTSAEHWSDDPDGLVTPYGNEIYIERGLVLYGGQKTFVGQGYYRIESVEQDDAPDGEVRIAAKDRMAGLIEARLEAPVQFGNNTSVQTVFVTLVLDVYPLATIEFDFDAAATTFPGSHIAERERFEFLKDVATGLGKIMYWDYRGVLVVRTAPELTDSVWSVNAGEGGVLVGMSRELNRDGVYNSVVVNGETPGEESFRAVARDMAPNSPTYWLGKYGKVTRFFSSPLINSQLSANQAAVSMLKRVLGLPRSINFRTVVNPALEVFDPVLITFSSKEPSQTHILDSINMPLGVEGAMTADTRDLTDAFIEVGDE